MAEKTELVDCPIVCPELRETAGNPGVEAERSAGRGGILELFPGVAERVAWGMSHQKVVATMAETGVDKGYPLITFDPSLDDVENLPFRDHVRTEYLRENALRLLWYD